MNNKKPDLMADGSGFKYEPPVKTEIEKKKPSKKKDDDIGYKIGFIALIVIIVGALGLTAWVMFSGPKEEEIVPVIPEVIDYASKIEVTELGTMDKYKEAKDILFKVKNNNSSIVSIKLSVTFYDENGNMTDTAEGTLSALGKNTHGYLVISTTYAYHNLKTKITADSVANTYTEAKEKLSEKHTIMDDFMSVEITNTNDKTVQGVNTCVIFYKDDTIVGFGVSNSYGIEPGDTALARINKPYDYNKSKAKSFNKYSVNLFGAYTQK